jgi:DUF1009 family protein/predicted dehydrogenase
MSGLGCPNGNRSGNRFQALQFKSMMKIGLIAGGGQFPLIFAKKAKAKGFAVYVAAYLNEASPDLKTHVEALEWVHLGQVNRVIKFFRKHHVADAVMMGSVKKTRMFSDVKPDIKAVSIIASMIHTHDDSILRAFARVLEKEGIQIRESTFLLPDLLAAEGCWTARKPSRSENTDIDLGWKLVKEIGRLDIGQCVGVGGGSVLAVEAIDGTDATILRGGKLSRDSAVVVKACKPNQDLRFDIPAVGVQTISAMHEAGARVLVIEPGKTVVLDREERIALAKKHGMTIAALGEGHETSQKERAVGDRLQVAGRRSQVAGDKSKVASDTQALTHKPQPATCNLQPATCAKLRVGVVGVGYLGKFHAEKYARMADVELVGVADIDMQQAENIAGKLGTKAYRRHQELIGKADAVSVVVPTHDHFAVSKDFLENNIDVLIEKPMTSTLEEADELIRIAESRGLIVQVGHLERFNPAVVALHGIVKKPMFIESHRLSVYKGRSMDVSVVLDLMIHDIDIISNFVKSEVRKIHASGVSIISGLLDIANARLEFESGCVANVTASRISMKNERKIRLFQKDAYFSVDFASREITAVRMRDDSGSEMPHLYDNTSNFELIPGTEITQTRFADGDALEQELKSFVNAVRKRETSEVTGQMGRDALKIALSIMEQIRRKND